MPELISAAPTPAAAAGQGTAPVSSGQADTAPAGSVAPARDYGQPTAPTAAQPEQPQPAGDSGLGWKSLTDAERDYKNLQGAYTKATQALQHVGPLEALQQERAFLQQLRNDPEFLQWAEQRLAQAQAGNADPSTVEAMKIVRQLARQEAAQMMMPLQAQAIAAKTETVFNEMSKAHGQEWAQFKPKMLEIHQRDMQRGLVSPNAEYNFDYDYVEGLYKRAIGSDPNYAAQQYAKKLAQKQSQVTTSSPGTSPAAVGTGKVNSFDDAVRAAKAQLGIG